MNKKEIKIHLKDNPQLIQQVLESIECHHVKIINNKKVTAGLPYPHDNTTSINIKLSDSLYTVVWTQNEFTQYEIQDFFTLIQYIKQCTLNEAISLVCKECGLNYTYNTKTNSSSAYKFLQKFKKTINKSAVAGDDEILPECWKDRFIPVISQQYLEDGVNEDSQAKFDIRYDILDNRIVFAIRNEIGSLLTFKGRTCNEEYKIRGIPKFLTYYPCSINHYLFGYYQNKQYISEADEVYVFEAEKGVMQADSMEVRNCLAANKKKLSEMQVNKLLKIGKPVVLAFDKDVTLEEIYIECKKFKGLIPVYYLYDTLDLLEKKNSPTDKGFNIFDRLINECKFEYKE